MISGEMEVEIVRPADDGGAQLWLTIRFPSGEELDVRIARTQLLEELGRILNGSRALRPGARHVSKRAVPGAVIDGMKFNVLDSALSLMPRPIWRTWRSCCSCATLWYCSQGQTMTREKSFPFLTVRQRRSWFYCKC